MVASGNGTEASLARIGALFDQYEVSPGTQVRVLRAASKILAERGSTVAVTTVKIIRDWILVGAIVVLIWRGEVLASQMREVATTLRDVRAEVTALRLTRPNWQPRPVRDTANSHRNPQR